MRVLFVSTQYPPETGGGGIGSYVADIGPALVARGHEVHVLSCAPGQPVRDYQSDGVHIHRRGRIAIRGLHRLLGYWAAEHLLQAVSAFVEHQRLRIFFDVVEVADWSAEGLFFSLLGRTPIVAHLHCGLRLLREQSGLPMKRGDRVADYLERVAVHHAHAITSPSYHHVGVLKRRGWLRERDVKVIRYPIIATQWHGMAAAEKTDTIVLQVGRVEPLKAPETLIRALGFLRDLKVRAIFVGRSTESYGDEMQRLAAGLGVRCEFTGYVPREQLAKFYAQARTIVLSSRFDNFPLGILEAMAAERPVIISDGVGVKELLSNGAAGVVVPHGNAEALTNALRPYLEDPERAGRAGRAGRALVERELAPEKIASQREAVYRDAVGEWQRRLLRRANGFPAAIRPQIGALEVPADWRRAISDETAFAPWKHFYLRLSEHVLRLLTAHPRFSTKDNLRGSRILDLGCTPVVSMLFAALGADVFLLDRDPEEFEKVRKLSSKIRLRGRLCCVQADAFHVPFAAERFDLVWNSGFIEHFNDPAAVLRIMGGLAKPNGAVIALVPNSWTFHSFVVRPLARRRRHGYHWDWMGRERSYSPRQLAALADRAGLKVLRSSGLDLRRSILDDSTILRVLQRWSMPAVLYSLMTGLDRLETNVPLLSAAGFMAGIVAQVP